MENLIVKILKDINKHFLTYFMLIIGILYGLLFKQGIVALVLFSLSIGILIGQNTKD